MSRLPEALLEHLRAPRNVGPPEGAGEVRSGEARNAACRDHVVLYLARGDDGRVAGAGFKAHGCPAALGMASAATELLPGLALDAGLPDALRARFVETFGEPAALHRHALALVTEAATGAVAS